MIITSLFIYLQKYLSARSILYYLFIYTNLEVTTGWFNSGSSWFFFFLSLFYFFNDYLNVFFLSLIIWSCYHQIIRYWNPTARWRYFSLLQKWGKLLLVAPSQWSAKRFLSQSYRRDILMLKSVDRKWETTVAGIESLWWSGEHASENAWKHIERTWPEVPITYLYDYVV